jgi:prevent-host-death family protein
MTGSQEPRSSGFAVIRSEGREARESPHLCGTATAASGAVGSRAAACCHSHSLPSQSLTSVCLSDKMSYMAKASVSIRELQQNLKRVMSRVERGETIEVTRRHRPVARLAPAEPTPPRAPWPDLKARRRAIFGDRIVSPAGSDVVIEGRGNR